MNKCLADSQEYHWGMFVRKFLWWPAQWCSYDSQDALKEKSSGNSKAECDCILSYSSEEMNLLLLDSLWCLVGLLL